MTTKENYSSSRKYNYIDYEAEESGDGSGDDAEEEEEEVEGLIKDHGEDESQSQEASQGEIGLYFNFTYDFVLIMF